MIRVFITFKKAEGKSFDWCSNFYRDSHCEFARKEFLKFPFAKKYSISKVLRQMELIKHGKEMLQPDFLWLPEIHFDSLEDLDNHLRTTSSTVQIQEDSVFASEGKVYICAEEEVLLDRK